MAIYRLFEKNEYVFSPTKEARGLLSSVKIPLRTGLERIEAWLGKFG